MPPPELPETLDADNPHLDILSHTAAFVKTADDLWTGGFLHVKVGEENRQATLRIACIDDEGTTQYAVEKACERPSQDP